MGLVEQPNVPGTTNEHPNWLRRLDPPTCDLLQQPVTKRRLELLGGSRKQ
jgi:4-alpha-glucanotransferase